MSDRLQAAADELAAQIGRVERTGIGPVPALWARRFAMACGETDAVFFDDAAAAAAGWAGTPLPPLLLTATRSWQPGPERDGLSDDGMPRVDIGIPAGHDLRVLGGGQSLHFHADALAGVDLVAEVELVNATPKEGRSGALLVVELQRRFSTVSGEPLLTCDETRILR